MGGPVGAPCGAPFVRVASAVAVADEGTAGPSLMGDRRTTVRGGSIDHDAGSCGGWAPLAGTGGGEVGKPNDGVALLGAQAVAVLRSAAAEVPASPAGDLRTNEPGGRPTVGAPAFARPARLIAGTLAGSAVVRVLRVAVPARPEGAEADEPHERGETEAADDADEADAPADEVRRRTGDDADRIDDPPVEEPTPAAATVVGDIMRSA